MRSARDSRTAADPHDTPKAVDLRAGDVNYRRFLEIAHEGIAMTDARDRFTFVNRRLERMLGRERGELIGKSLLDFVDEESRPVAARHFAQIRGGVSDTAELRVQRKDGLAAWLVISSSPCRQDGRDDGAYAGCLSLMTHATDRKRYEDELRDQNELFESMLRAQSDLDVGVAITEADRYAYVNEAFARICGYTVDEILALPSAFELVVPEERDAFKAHWYQRAADVDSASRVLEAGCVHKTGRRLHVEYAVKPFHHGGREQRIAVVRDVTERKQMQARIILADRMASVGTLAAGIAHEINNPLAYVTANLELMSEEVRTMTVEEPSSHVRELETMMHDARQGAERVQKIVRDLRAFSRADEERRVPLDVRKVLELSINMTFNEIKHRARLVKDFAEVVPVEADETRLSQVFINLLVNAAQAIPEGHADRNEIRVVTRMHGSDRVLVEVRDTGSGIPQNIANRIFEPFFTTKEVGQGTGLGLSICHGIVTGLGGEISVESVVGKGSLFRVLLRSASPDAVWRPQAPAPAASPAPVPRARVLVVDDETVIGVALRRTLDKEHDVTVLTDCRAALDLLLQGKRFDVIFCDLMMPQMTGMEFHANVCSNFPEIAERIVFMTGGAFTPAARSFLDTVPNQRLEKPFSTQHLKSVVRGFLR